MIHANRIVTVGDQESIIDRPIVLYRGDREVEIEFTLVGNEFTFSEEGNVIKSVNASHGQLVLNTPSGEHMFSELAECHEGKVVFVVTKEMIDEFIEMGFYSFQIRLYDSAEMKSRVTIPPVMNGFDIRNPIAAEDETNVVDQGIVDYARIFKDQSNEELPTFTWDGEYVKTEWVHHDVITENKLNKIEDALYSINANVKESDVVMLNTLDQVKKDADAYVKEHMAEVEADVEEFERSLNTGVEKFKVDTNAAMTAHKNEVSEELESVKNGLVYLNVISHGAKGDGINDDSVPIQKVLNKGGNIYIPEGEYLINKTLVLKEGTNLLMDKNAVLYNNIHQTQPKGLKCISIFANYDVDYTVNGYNLAGNIKISGGMLVGVRSEQDRQLLADLGDVGQDGISISHGKNIIIENVYVKDTFRGHGIEITGCTDVIIDNCTVNGCVLTDLDVTRVKEAIQIEHSGTSGESITSPSMQDNTVSKNITVRNCIIQGQGDSTASVNSQNWGSGIGSHNNGNTSVMENIVIEDNQIYDCLHAGIMLINYKNSKIKNNFIVGGNWGIGYYQARPLANVTISENTIEYTVKGGISIFDGAYGLTIENNRLANIEGVGISLVDATNLVIHNNKFLNCGIDSSVEGIIQVYGIKQSDISNNYMYKTVENGVKRGIFIGGTDVYQNFNVTYSNNKIEFECSEEDIYLHNTARTSNSNVLFKGSFGIFNDSVLSLNKTLYCYNAIRIDTDTFGSTIVPVSEGTIKVVLSDIGQNSNAFTAIEFTLNLDTLGKTITINSTRYMSISNGTQHSQEITQALSIMINKIIGI